MEDVNAIGQACDVFPATGTCLAVRAWKHRACWEADRCHQALEAIEHNSRAANLRQRFRVALRREAGATAPITSPPALIGTLPAKPIMFGRVACPAELAAVA